MKKISIYASAFMAMFLLTACMGNDDNAEDQKDNTAAENTATNDQNTDNDITDDNQNNDADLDVADKAADKVEEIEEVKDAAVLLTDHRAYTAVDLQNGTNVSDDLKNKIEEKVKEADTSVEKVYVSADPDFSKQMKEYADRIEAGEPVEGFFEEFSDTVQRVFPSS
ncbi:YhcN/YlaJ family sporulation lipoprotein [Domibacillus sp. A3M-37]|uniref:YhcN/YlaJ family sporulation lipoprotein n=1 Tax=Domibacillus sp. A3M-37 TaxID=2962037 RepID=UPI0020B84753|nr:YhcN/YlaJ family sporulation lipoprotein [Domibacillus sp. A3M-37]MCP3764115.1 YhcN/YlaJ family sporulation lipoprotein [Domibacillus sp. A3M-37]